MTGHQQGSANRQCQQARSVTRLRHEAKGGRRVRVALRQYKNVHVVLQRAGQAQGSSAYAGEDTHGLDERTSRVHRKEQEPSVTTGGAEDSLLCSTCVRNASAMCRLCTTRRIALS